MRSPDQNNEDEDAVGDHHVDDTRLYLQAAAAFCRGRLNLTGVDDDDAVSAGQSAGLRLHRFKRSGVLPRVQRTLATLQGLMPTSLLDLGTGRGAFLWPLLDSLPSLPVHCLDLRVDRIADVQAVAKGGPWALQASCGTATSMPFVDDEFDIVTALEVLEHVDDVAAAAREIVRVARRFAVVTVPSQADNNPEHLRLFTKETLKSLFVNAGASRVNVDGVRGHFFAVVSVGAKS